MKDPMAENISGEKVQRHVFKHQINWGHVAVAVAVIYVMMQVSASISDGQGDEQGKTENPGLGTEV